MSLDIETLLHTCIVPLETVENNQFTGTGFFLEGYYCKDDPSRGIPVIITNRHVVKDNKIQFRVNRPRGGLSRFQIGNTVKGSSFDWVLHPDEKIDLAVAICPYPSDQIIHVLNSEIVGDISNHIEGRELFYLGFPLAQGAEAETHHQPILRMGTLSRKSDPAFIMEANVFPGSSGSPVFTKPRMQVDENGNVIIEPYRLLGVVSSYIPYQDVAVSKQTGRDRILFEDNSGLSFVYKIQYLSEVMNCKEFTDQAKPILKHLEDRSGIKFSPVCF